VSDHAARRPGKYLVVAVVLALFALLVYGLVSKGTTDRIDEALGDGHSTPAPGFKLELLEPGTIPPALQRRTAKAFSDGKLSLAELRGTPVVLNFWASWCPPCRDEAGSLQRAWTVAGKSGVLFVGLDVQDLRGDARAFLDEFGITYPTVREPGKEVAKSYGATGFPETFFIDKRGRVVGHVIGSIDAKQLGTGVVAAAKGEIAGVGSGGQSFSR